MPATVEYVQMSQRVRNTLHKAFGPEVAVQTDEGQFGHVFVKMVSTRFNEMTEEAKQNAIWEALQRKLGDDAKSVALVLALGLNEV